MSIIGRKWVKIDNYSGGTLYTLRNTSKLIFPGSMPLECNCFDTNSSFNGPVTISTGVSSIIPLHWPFTSLKLALFGYFCMVLWQARQRRTKKIGVLWSSLHRNTEKIQITGSLISKIREGCHRTLLETVWHVYWRPAVEFESKQ